MPGHKKRAAGGRKPDVIRVLVAEDHTVVRDGLVAIIKQEADMDVVAETGDGRQAAELWKKHRPDITLMDLRMPGMDGVNAIYQIRAADPNARIIVLTTYDGDEDIYRGIRAGAKSYLLKDVRRQELFQCIREVHAGRTFLPAAVAAKLAERLPTEELTPRELEVLRLLAAGKPNKLIGADLAITEVTVKSHVQSVFRKLNVLSRTEATAVANRRGLLRVALAAVLILNGCSRREETAGSPDKRGDGAHIQPGAIAEESERWGYLALKIAGIHERQKPLDQSPWHADGGDWTFLECELAKEPAVKILVGTRTRSSEKGDIPLSWGEARLAVSDASAGARFIEAFAKAFHLQPPPSHGNKSFLVSLFERQSDTIGLAVSYGVNLKAAVRQFGEGDPVILPHLRLPTGLLK